MNCPVCETVELALAERERVEIDYCPRCRGVWLDRGELDKVIERYDSGTRKERDDSRSDSRSDDRYDDDRYDDDRDDDDRGSRGGRRRRRGRESMLGDLFDFGG